MPLKPCLPTVMDSTLKPCARINLPFCKLLLPSTLLQQEQKYKFDTQQKSDISFVVVDILDTWKAGTGRATEVMESSGVSSICILPKAPMNHSLPVLSDLHAGLQNGANPWHPVACQIPVSRQKGHSGLLGGGLSMSWYNRWGPVRIKTLRR